MRALIKPNAGAILLSITFFFNALSAASVAQVQSTSRENLLASRNRLGSAALTITNWVIFGAFSDSDAKRLWEDDLLATENLHETAESASDLLGAASKDFGTVGNSPRCFSVEGGEFIDFKEIFKQPYDRGIEPSAVYAGCNIIDNKGGRRYLLVGSSDSCKVWVNGQLQQSSWQRRGVYKYSDANSIELKAGVNFILFKVVRAGLTWGLTVRIENDVESATTSALKGQGMLDGIILRTSIVNKGKVLELNVRGVPSEAVLKIKISDLFEHSIYEAEASNGSFIRLDPLLASGIYQIKVSESDTAIVQRFLWGSAEEEVMKLINAASRVASADIWDSVEPLVRRVKLLLDTDYTKDDRTFVYTAAALSEVLGQPFAGNAKGSVTPGLHIRSFVSTIDQQRQYYRIYVPRSAAFKIKVPLVVVLPTTISASKPFIESTYLKAHSEAERMAAIAERLNIALLWPGYRNQPCGAPCEFAHIDEAIRAAERDVKLDESRVTLFTACSGGAIATMLSAHYPERFAGVGLLNPMFAIDHKISPTEITTFRGKVGFSSWMSENNVVPDFLRLGGFGTYIIHDGAEPGHGDIATSLRFVALAKKDNAEVKFERTGQTLSQHFGAIESLMEWLSKQRRSAASTVPGSSYVNMPYSYRSIADSFTCRVTFVVGTHGTAQDCAALAECASKIRDSWRQTFFGKCRIIDDELYLSANVSFEGPETIVLIGDPISNSVWNSLVPRSKIVVNESGISLFGQKYNGKQIRYHAAFAEEARTGIRNIVVIGATEPRYLKFPSINLPLNGWYQYAVWLDESTLIDAVPGQYGR